jgi:hypothetical protein
MSSTFSEMCRQVVTWVREPSKSASVAPPGVGHAHVAHPIVHLHPVPTQIAGSTRGYTGGTLRRIHGRLQHAGMKKVVAWACVVTGGIAGAAVAIDKVALVSSDADRSGLSPAAVSEPSSFYLFAFGVAALGLVLHWAHRKRRARRASRVAGGRAALHVIGRSPRI